jgi:hypothetical protein
MVLSLVLGGVALAAAADLPQVSKNLDLSAMQKISDQELKQLTGTGMTFGPQFGGFSGLGNPACQQSLTTVCIPIKDQTRTHLQTSRR